MSKSLNPASAPHAPAAGVAPLSERTKIFRFIVSGGISAVFDYGLTLLLQLAFEQDPWVARSAGFVVGTTVAYIINRRWTFQAEKSWSRLIQVAVLYTITYFVNVVPHEFFSQLFLEWGWAKWFAASTAFVISQGTATVINYVIQSVWIFRNPRG